jgi:hypothetical protein
VICLAIFSVEASSKANYKRQLPLHLIADVCSKSNKNAANVTNRKKVNKLALNILRFISCARRATGSKRGIETKKSTYFKRM